MLLKRKTSAETLKLQEKYGVPYLVFPSLENTGLVRHAFSTRLGGCSTGDLATMNLSSTRGDDPENVKENFQRFGAAVGFVSADSHYQCAPCDRRRSGQRLHKTPGL